MDQLMTYENLLKNINKNKIKNENKYRDVKKTFIYKLNCYLLGLSEIKALRIPLIEFWDGVISKDEFIHFNRCVFELNKEEPKYEISLSLVDSKDRENPDNVILLFSSIKDTKNEEFDWRP